MPDISFFTKGVKWKQNVTVKENQGRAKGKTKKRRRIRGRRWESVTYFPTYKKRFSIFSAPPQNLLLKEGEKKNEVIYQITKQDGPFNKSYK